MNIEIIEIEKKTDSRGWLLKILMNRQVPGDKAFGEIYLVTAEPGQARGGHYHESATEWFCVVQGAAVLNLRDMRSGETMELELSAGAPRVVVVPAGIGHHFENRGAEPMLLLAYADREYDPAAPDTIPWN